MTDIEKLKEDRVRADVPAASVAITGIGLAAIKGEKQ